MPGIRMKRAVKPISIVVPVRFDWRHKPRKIYPKRTSQAVDVHKRDVTAAALQASDVSDMESSSFREGLLGETAG